MIPETNPHAEPASAAADRPEPVVRHVLSSAHPTSAPGETLELVQYIIPAGSVLPVHTHPGVQMATVESGALTYHVIDHGQVTVTRADGSEETVGPGEQAIFSVGDSWVEPIGMIHYAENHTATPVVLISSSLLDDNAPPSALVKAPPPG